MMELKRSYDFADNTEKHSGNSKITQLSDLPTELLQYILKYFSFSEIGKFRLISKDFNKVCGDLLNEEFDRLKMEVQVRYSFVKAAMPRRESSRRKHVLSRENDIIETLHMRLALLNLTVGKHVEKNHCCFFAGEVLDEANRLINYVKSTVYLNRPFKVTDELFDLSTMAVEYFKDHIEPTLPEIVYISENFGSSVSNSRKTNKYLVSEVNKTLAVEKQIEIPISSIQELKKSLRGTRKIIVGNRRMLANIKSSMQSLDRNINNLENIIHQFKKEQKDCKEISLPRNCQNELLLHLHQCNLMIDLLDSHLPSKPRTKKMPSAGKDVSNFVLETRDCHEELNDLSNYNAKHDSNVVLQSTGDTLSCCLSTSQITRREEKVNELPNLRNQNIISASKMVSRRKENEESFKNISKKRKLI